MNFYQDSSGMGGYCGMYNPGVDVMRNGGYDSHGSVSGKKEFQG